MSTPPEQAPRRKPRRRWFQFGLSTLLAGTALAAGGAMAWRVCIEPYRQQRATMALIEKLHGSYKTADADGWVRWLIGKDCQNITSVDLAACDDPEAYLGQVVSLPVIETLAVGGPNLSDGHLQRLHRLKSLGLLVLDSTCVSDDAVDRIRRALPATEVIRGDRRAIAELKRNRVELRTDLAESPTLRRSELGADAGEVVLSVRHHYGADADSQLALLKTLHRLETIDLDRSTFSNAGLASLAGLRRVSVLSLDRTRVTGDGLVSLRGMGQLRGLSLESTDVADADLAHLAHLSTLEGLYLDGTAVGDEGLVHIGGLTSLRGLGLGRTRVTDAGLRHLSRLTQLRSLWLRRTDVSDASLGNLRALSQLQFLDLTGTRVTVRGIANLEQSLPGCQIRY